MLGRDPGRRRRRAATIDPLVHHAHVIALNSDSYRTRAHRKPLPPAANTK